MKRILCFLLGALFLFTSSSFAVNVKDHGAVGDGVTDDTASFLSAKAAITANDRLFYIPGLPQGKYYKLTQDIVFDEHSVTIDGDGVGSLICAYNNQGKPAIKVTAPHVTIKNIGVTGIAGSGHGIQLGEVGNPAHFPQIDHVWIGWMGGNDLEIVEAISGVYTAVNLDHDSGYRPATLIGATEGARLHGVNIHKSSTGINNDQKFIGCTLNSSSNDTGSQLRIGIDGTGTFEMFEWVGGLIQGQSVNGKLIEAANSQRLHFYGGDYEPNGGITGVFSFTDTNYVTFTNSLLQGDVSFLNSGWCTIRDSSVNSVIIGETSHDTVIDNTVYGTTYGTIKDYSNSAVLSNLTNGSNQKHHQGNRLRKGTPEIYLNERMDYWNGGGAPTNPTHLSVFTGTVTPDSTIKYTGKYSAKLVASQSTDKLFALVNAAGMSEILVDAWVYNATTAGLAKITGRNYNTGADSSVTSNSINKWERIQVTFTPTTDCGLFFVDLGVSAPGTVYWGAIKISVPSAPLEIEKTLVETATPHLCADNLVIRSFLTGGTTTITGFTYPIVGEPFTLRFNHNKIIAHGAAIKLAGSVSFFGKPGDMLTLVYGTDGVFREVSRMVL